jgi:membrane protein involved in colicin uptake
MPFYQCSRTAAAAEQAQAEEEAAAEKAAAEEAAAEEAAAEEAAATTMGASLSSTSSVQSHRSELGNEAANAFACESQSSS